MDKTCPTCGQPIIVDPADAVKRHLTNSMNRTIGDRDTLSEDNHRRVTKNRTIAQYKAQIARIEQLQALEKDYKAGKLSGDQKGL